MRSTIVATTFAFSALFVWPRAKHRRRRRSRAADGARRASATRFALCGVPRGNCKNPPRSGAAPPPRAAGAGPREHRDYKVAAIAGVIAARRHVENNLDRHRQQRRRPRSHRRRRHAVRAEHGQQDLKAGSER